MLKRLNELPDLDKSVNISEACFPAPFKSGLEYSPPARGTWNIVHIGMLIPKSHQIYVCAENCLRGVVLTAAEMGEQKRFSTVAINEENVLDGDMESLIIEGVTDILNSVEELPPAVLVFTSCIHHFMGCDLNYCYKVLRSRFPQTAFTDCYMNPIMRKSGYNPDQLMRMRLYSLLEPKKLQENSVNIIGNCNAMDSSSELIKILTDAKKTIRDITCCKTYTQYQDMAKSFVNICNNPSALPAVKELKERLNQDYIYLPFCFELNEIENQLNYLAKHFNISYDCKQDKDKAIDALKHLKSVIKNTAVAIDYTAVTRPLNLARVLTEYEINVKFVYADSFTSEEKNDFDFLKEKIPNLKIYPTVNTSMRIAPKITNEKIIAIGQKAAYFTGTENFVNIVEGGGLFGFDGVVKMCSLIEEAYRTQKDASKFIQQKGLGCNCCL